MLRWRRTWLNILLFKTFFIVVVVLCASTLLLQTYQNNTEVLSESLIKIEVKKNPHILL